MKAVKLNLDVSVCSHSGVRVVVPQKFLFRSFLKLTFYSIRAQSLMRWAQ